MAVADLIMLIVGVALALALPWGNEWQQMPQPVMEPRWRIIGQFIEEAVGKTAFALIPLVLWRRARLGGICRPAELLLAVCAAWMLLDQVDRCPWVSSARIEHETWDELGWPFWLCHGAAGTLALLAMLALMMLRQKLDDARRSVLLIIAVAGSFPWFVEPIDRMTNDMIDRYQIEDTHAALFIFVATRILQSLVPGIVGAAAIRDVFRRRFDIGLLEWVAVVLALINLSVSLTVWFYGYFMPGFPPPSNAWPYVIYFGPVLASGAIGWLIASVAGSRFYRFLECENPER